MVSKSCAEGRVSIASNNLREPIPPHPRLTGRFSRRRGSAAVTDRPDLRAESMPHYADENRGDDVVTETQKRVTAGGHPQEGSESLLVEVSE